MSELKNIWKNIEVMKWLDHGPLHESRKSLVNICPMITQAFKRNPKAKILDVACGPGSVLKRMLKRKVPVTPVNYLGVDYSPQALKLAKKHFPKYQFKLMDVIEDTLPQFEIISCMDIFQHLANPLVLLENIYQATKKICFINTWAKVNGEDWDQFHTCIGKHKFKCIHRVFDLNKLETTLKLYDWKLVYSKIVTGNEWAGILVKNN